MSATEELLRLRLEADNLSMFDTTSGALCGCIGCSCSLSGGTIREVEVEKRGAGMEVESDLGGVGGTSSKGISGILLDFS